MVVPAKERHISEVHILAIDLAKPSFQVCPTAPGGAVLFNRRVSRARLEKILSEQAPCIVAMEACATSHYWGRFAQSLTVCTGIDISQVKRTESGSSVCYKH